MNVLMAFESELRINPRQCRLLAEACAHALAAVTGEVRVHLRFEEGGGVRWRALKPSLQKLLCGLRVAVDERDVSMDAAYLAELHRFLSRVRACLAAGRSPVQ
jgi:hypothetical protein